MTPGRVLEALAAVVAPQHSAGCYVDFGAWSDLLALQEAGLVRDLLVIEPEQGKLSMNYFYVIFPPDLIGMPVGPLYRWYDSGHSSFFLLTDRASHYVHHGEPNSTGVGVVTATVKRVDVTGIVEDKGRAHVEAMVEYELTPFGKILRPDLKNTREEMRLEVILYDEGWRVVLPEL